MCVVLILWLQQLLTHQESNARSIESALESTRDSVGHEIKGRLAQMLDAFSKICVGRHIGHGLLQVPARDAV